MKKLTTLTFALLFTAGIAFAQNNSSTVQFGSGNDANIDQTHTYGWDNNAFVYQEGKDNAVEDLVQLGGGNNYNVFQVGNKNVVTAFPKQGDESPSYHGFINIIQAGNKNVVHDADQSGWGNRVIVNQLGDDNFVDVEAQITSGIFGNSVAITQIGDDNALGTGSSTGAFQKGSFNHMDITQKDGASAGTETVSLFGYPSHEGGQGLVQIGIKNALTIDQDGSGNEVRFTMQAGAFNHAVIEQGSGTNSADVWQLGVGNSANVTQNGNGMGNGILL